MLCELLLTSSGVFILIGMNGLLETHDIKKSTYMSFSGKWITYILSIFSHQIFKRSQYPPKVRCLGELVGWLVLLGILVLFCPQFSSVAQSSPTLCNPMNRSSPGLPVYHQLPESTQTHVHRVSDAIQPSHPRASPSPAPNPSQHQGLFQ